MTYHISRPRMTPQRRDLIRALLAKGYNYHEISWRLSVAYRTIAKVKRGDYDGI